MRRAVILPSLSSASSPVVIMSRPWSSARKDSVRSALQRTGRPSSLEAAAVVKALNDAGFQVKVKE